jgi:anthranilate phosphoribosyltransferase
MACSRASGASSWPRRTARWDRYGPWWFTATAALDEFAPAGATFVAELADGQVRGYEVRPADFGLAEANAEGLRGGEPAFNASKLLETLRGEGGASRVAALMTAAAGLVVTGLAKDLREGAARATQALDSGKAVSVLEALRRIAPLPDKP